MFEYLLTSLVSRAADCY